MKRMKKISRLFLMFLLCISMAAAPSRITADAAAKTVSTAKQKDGLNYESLVLLTGQKKTLSLTGASGKVVWSSKDPSVVTVTQKGKVTALKKGKTTITAKTASAKYVCKITVQTPKLNCKAKTMTKGVRLQLRVKGTDQTVTWKSSSKKIASVSSKGVVTARSAGKCKIYAVILGKKYTCSITVKTSGTQSSGSSGSQANVSYVWVSATGSKYHKISSCGNMNPSKARKLSLSEAQKNYSACSKCF